MGIEPTWPAWKAGALPLSYTRTDTEGNGWEPVVNVFPGGFKRESNQERRPRTTLRAYLTQIREAAVSFKDGGSKLICVVPCKGPNALK